jgi:DNA replication and repair protein RecF
MRVVAVGLRDFRSYGEAQAVLGEGLTVVTGPNGAGKTNLLEAIYFGCTGRSCRTNTEREVVRWKAPWARVAVDVSADDGPHELTVAFVPGEPKRMRVDGAAVERLVDVGVRPLVSVFLPDRLDLIKGPPALRRAHLDQFVAAMWPARVAARRAYAQALAQRNALISQIRSGRGSRGLLTAWDQQLARHGVALMADRSSAVGVIAEHFARIAIELGLEGDPTIAYRPRSQAADPAELATELAQRVDVDLERGFTGHGPHRDEVVLTHQGRDLRPYGSQGQQRLALLSLLLAEREALSFHRESPPLMLLDDVMSELDGDRRLALTTLLRDGGQAVITTTDVEHVPGAWEDGVARIVVTDSQLLQEAVPSA